MSKKEVIKHSSTIQVTNTINLVQRRAWNILLANAYDDLPKQEIFQMPLSELHSVLNLDRRNKNYLKHLLKSLVSTIVEWNILEKDTEKEWGATTVLAQVKIKEGMLTYAYAPELRSQLYNPRMYARISLSMQNKFNSKHSLALYELFIDYYDTSRAYGETPYILIEAYRKLMGIEPGEYEEFKTLSKRCIKEPVDEINTKSDLAIEINYKTIERKVTAVKFKIKRKSGVMLPPAKEDDLFTNKTREKLIETGVTKAKAVELTQRFSNEIIDKWVRCINEGYVSNISNKAGYIIKALEEEYSFPKGFDGQIEREKVVMKRRISTENKEKKEKEMLRIKDMEEEKFLTYIISLVSEEREKLYRETIREMKKDKEEYNQMRKHYNLDLGTLTFTEFQQLDKHLLRVTVDGYMKEVLKAQGKI